MSEEYLLYDLTKNKGANRIPSLDSSLDTVGRVMYPAVAGGVPFFHGALAEKETHAFRSNAFYWSDDSRTVVFADSVEKTLSVVMVTIDADQTHAFTHQVTAAEACEQGSKGDIQSSTLMLSHAAITSNGIELQFRSYDYGACKPVAYTLSAGDFTAAKFEVHGPPHRKDHSTMKEQ